MQNVLQEYLTHLNQSILAQQRAGESGRCSQKPGVCHFLHSLSNGQNQSGVDERHDDVGIKLV